MSDWHAVEPLIRLFLQKQSDLGMHCLSRTSCKATSSVQNSGIFTVNYNMGLDARKPCLRWFANDTGPDQPAHPRSLISAFVIRLLESIICKLATGEISTF